MSTIDQHSLWIRSQQTSSSFTTGKKPAQNIDPSIDTVFHNMLASRMRQSDTLTPQANTEQVSDHQSERQIDQGRSATQHANHLANSTSETNSTQVHSAKSEVLAQSERSNQTADRPGYREKTDQYSSRSALGAPARSLSEDPSLADGVAAGQGPSTGLQADGTSFLSGVQSVAALGAGVLACMQLGQGATAIAGIAGKLADVAQSMGSAAASVTGIETSPTQSLMQTPPLAETKGIFASQGLASLTVQPGTNVHSVLGSAQWNQELSQQVIWMAAGAGQSASLTLNPPDLGPLHVVIHVHNNMANATFISDSPDVRQALTDGLQSLKEMMSQVGIELGQTNVSSGDAHRNHSQDTLSKENKRLVASEKHPDSVSLEDILHSTLSTHVMTSKGLVDTFA